MLPLHKSLALARPALVSGRFVIAGRDVARHLPRNERGCHNGLLPLHRVTRMTVTSGRQGKLLPGK
jgi:hypothetical protein